MPGRYVPLKETIRSFRMINDGECGNYPLDCFLFAEFNDQKPKKAGRAGTV